MKKIALLLSLSFLVFSCSSDDDSDSGSLPSDLIGTWVLTQSFVDGEEDDELNICDLMDNYVFTSSEFTVTTYYEMAEECVVDDTFTGPYSATDNTITLDGDIVNYSIDGSELTLEYEGVDVVDGVEEEFSEILIYTKQ